MSVSPPSSPPPSQENPTRRFKRLLSSADEEKLLADQETPVSKTKPSAETIAPPERGISRTEGETSPSAPREKSEKPKEQVSPPPSLGSTPQRAQPAIGTQNMPLPRRVDEIDVNATRVTPASYQPPSRKQASAATRRIAISPARPKPFDAKLSQIDWRRGMGCLLRMFILALFAAVILAIISGTIVLSEYYAVASSLPSVEDLRQRASQFETTRILDRNGNVLYEILDPNAGRRTYVKLERVSPYLVAATIATEDSNFYSHPGFDPLAILRAFWQNFQSGGETVSGASTITQQVARNLLFSNDERLERTYRRKVREAIAAAEITRKYSKEEILEIYLNENFYGNYSYGVQAAAETYFNTTADKLTLAQAAFLAGLPQAPSVYDIFHNRDATLKRMQQVLILLYELSQERNCIYVSNNPQPICVDSSVALEAYTEIQNYQFKVPEISIRSPHWVNYIRSQLEAQYDAQTIYRSGFQIYTTLDPGLQEEAQRLVKERVKDLAAYNAHNGALVAIRPATGEILAMVGSVDYNSEEIDGQVNMATSPTRQPGSTIKPFTYLTAFEKGWTPATLIWDAPSEFPPSGDPADPRPPYKPVNYDERFHGPVLVRAALANSYNVPAVKALQFVGIYDDPKTPNRDGLIAMLERLGVTSLSRLDYGLSLTLGGGEISLLEMTSAYAVLANGGFRLPSYGISRILDHSGNVVFEYKKPAGEQIVRAEHAFLISSILSDNAARSAAFGQDSVLNLPFPAAVKTGTTNDFRDNWTVGYTPDVAIGVWIGNADYTPMQNTSGLTGAAPIWADFIQLAVQRITGGNPTPFYKPASVVDRIICALSGSEPSDWCPSQRREYFAADQLPLSKEQDLWTKVRFDTWTGLRASPACATFTGEKFAINVTDPWAIAWIAQTDQGRIWSEEMGFKQPLLFVPPRDCKAEDQRPFLEFVSPRENQVVNSAMLDIFGRADASGDFKNFTLSYGMGENPLEWKLLLERAQPVSQPDRLITWNLSETFPGGIPSGVITLRLQMNSIRNTYAEAFIHINLQVPTPTATATTTFTPTPTATNTPTQTSTPTFTYTFTPTSSGTATLPPTNTPTVTLTPVPPTSTSTATATSTVTATSTATLAPPTPTQTEVPPTVTETTTPTSE